MEKCLVRKTKTKKINTTVPKILKGFIEDIQLDLNVLVAASNSFEFCVSGSTTKNIWFQMTRFKDLFIRIFVFVCLWQCLTIRSNGAKLFDLDD